MRNFFIKLISTFFFIGYTPFIPGSVASLAAILIVWLLKGHFYLYLAVTLVLIILGFFVSQPAEKIFKRKDAPQIVIDEVSGIFLSLLFLPISLRVVFCAFILFRIFDALKVFPGEKLHNLSGGKGIMFDDIAAAFYTNILLQVVLRLAEFSAS